MTVNLTSLIWALIIYLIGALLAGITGYSIDARQRRRWRA